MPINSPKDYLPVLDEFLAHWPLVNAALAPGVLALPNNYLVAALTAARAALAAQLNAVEQAANNAQAAAADRFRWVLFRLVRQPPHKRRDRHPQLPYVHHRRELLGDQQRGT